MNQIGKMYLFRKQHEINLEKDNTYKIFDGFSIETCAKRVVEFEDNQIVSYLYDKYKETDISKIYVISKPDFERFLKEMLPKWKENKNDLRKNNR